MQLGFKVPKEVQAMLDSPVFKVNFSHSFLAYEIIFKLYIHLGIQGLRGLAGRIGPIGILFYFIVKALLTCWYL